MGSSDKPTSWIETAGVAVVAALAFLNLFAALIAGVWLLIFGSWLFVGTAVLANLPAPWLMGRLFAVGTRLFGESAASSAAQGRTARACAWGFLYGLFQYGIVAAFALAEFMLFGLSGGHSRMPCLLLGYGLTALVLQVMGWGKRPDDPATLMAITCGAAAYLGALAAWFCGGGAFLFALTAAAVAVATSAYSTWLLAARLRARPTVEG